MDSYALVSLAHFRISVSVLLEVRTQIVYAQTKEDYMTGSIITVKTRNGTKLYLDALNRFNKDKSTAKVFGSRRIAEDIIAFATPSAARFAYEIEDAE